MWGWVLDPEGHSMPSDGWRSALRCCHVGQVLCTLPPPSYVLCRGQALLQPQHWVSRRRAELVQHLRPEPACRLRKLSPRWLGLQPAGRAARRKGALASARRRSRRLARCTLHRRHLVEPPVAKEL